MSLVIGILGRPKKDEREFTSFSKAVTDVIIEYGNLPLGIIAPVIDINSPMKKDDILKLHRLIDMCDGFILQGGSDYYEYDLEALKYMYVNDIPVLGICLGMQSMGVAFGGTLVHVPNHNHKGIDYVHDVNIEPSSKLRMIINSDRIMVNSRHNDMVINPETIDAVGMTDNKIEALEKGDASFFIGVQWHPEDMIKYDSKNRKLFDAFFKAADAYHEKKIKM